MKRILLLICLLLPGVTWSQKPIYVQVSFNTNYFPTPGDADTNVVVVKRHAALMESYGWKADYYLTWLSYKQLVALEPTLFSALRAEGLRFHHHGANRPPHPTPIELINKKSWDEAVALLRDYETHDLDPTSGRLLLSLPGGRAQILKDLDDALLSDGRMLRAPIYFVEKELGAKVGVGLQSNLRAPQSDVWFMGMLNRPETVSLEPSLWNHREPSAIPAMMDSILRTLDRSRFQMIALLAHDSDFLLRPISTEVQTRPLAPFALRERVWERYKAILDWMKARTELQFLTIAELLERVEPDVTREFQKPMVEYIAQELTRQEPLTAVPLYFEFQNDYASLADALQMLAASLRSYIQDRTLPASVSVGDVLAPTALLPSTPPSYSPTGLPQASFAEALQAVKDVNNFAAGFIPELLPVGNQKLNAAEYLHLLARAYQNILAGDTSSAFQLYHINVLPPQIAVNNAVADTITKLQFWTYKPVRWKTPVTSVSNAKEISPPAGFILYQNHPNPFNPTTVISFQLSANPDFPLNDQSRKVGVTLKVFDLNGREVARLVEGNLAAGNHAVTFNASNLPSGIYLIRLATGQFTQTRKAVLIR